MRHPYNSYEIKELKYVNNEVVKSGREKRRERRKKKRKNTF